MTSGNGVHTVLAMTEGEAFGSLRKRPTSRRERFAMGRALRKQVPRKSLGDGRHRPTGRTPSS